MVTEVKLHCFHVSAAVAAKIFLTFMKEFGNSKLFETYLFFHHSTTTYEETSIYFRHHGSAVVLPTDDLADSLFP